MSKKDIETLFTQYQGNFKLLSIKQLDELKKVKNALGISIKLVKQIFCIDEKIGYAIVKIA